MNDPLLKTTATQRAEMRLKASKATQGKWILNAAAKGSGEDWWIVVEAEDDDLLITEALNNNYYMKPEHKLPIAENRRGNMPYIEAVQPETVLALLDDADTAERLAEENSRLQSRLESLHNNKKPLDCYYDCVDKQEAKIANGRAQEYILKELHKQQEENSRLQARESALIEALTLIRTCTSNRLEELTLPKRVDEMNAEELAVWKVMSVAVGAIMACQRWSQEAIQAALETILPLNTPPPTTATQETETR